VAHPSEIHRGVFPTHAYKKAEVFEKTCQSSGPSRILVSRRLRILTDTMIFSKKLYSILSLVASTFAEGSPARDGIKLTSGGALPSGIVNPEALQELEANITAYTKAANYGSASFNRVHPLYPGAVGL
jgi:hypothetical protein